MGGRAAVEVGERARLAPARAHARARAAARRRGAHRPRRRRARGAARARACSGAQQRALGELGRRRRRRRCPPRRPRRRRRRARRARPRARPRGGRGRGARRTRRGEPPQAGGLDRGVVGALGERAHDERIAPLARARGRGLVAGARAPSRAGLGTLRRAAPRSSSAPARAQPLLVASRDRGVVVVVVVVALVVVVVGLAPVAAPSRRVPSSNEPRPTAVSTSAARRARGRSPPASERRATSPKAPCRLARSAGAGVRSLDDDAGSGRRRWRRPAHLAHDLVGRGGNPPACRVAAAAFERRRAPTFGSVGVSKNCSSDSFLISLVHLARGAYPIRGCQRGPGFDAVQRRT